jgi:hypothetical protein
MLSSIVSYLECELVEESYNETCSHTLSPIPSVDLGPRRSVAEHCEFSQECEEPNAPIETCLKHNVNKSLLIFLGLVYLQPSLLNHILF